MKQSNIVCLLIFCRISFSNLFKEFKSTSTWLQFPFAVSAHPDSVDFQTSKHSKKGNSVFQTL